MNVPRRELVIVLPVAEVIVDEGAVSCRPDPVRLIRDEVR